MGWLNAKEPWQEQAACLGMDPDIFFPKQGESTQEAKAVCRRCPVKEECLELCLSREEKGGIWGGTSQKERKPMRKERARIAREQKSK